MTAPKNKKDIRILSPRDLIATAESDTGLLRLRTSRDVLPGMDFTPDSSALVASYGGRIWRIPVDGSAPVEIDGRSQQREEKKREGRRAYDQPGVHGSQRSSNSEERRDPVAPGLDEEHGRSRGRESRSQRLQPQRPAEAHRALEARQTTGCTVLTID